MMRCGRWFVLAVGATLMVAPQTVCAAVAHGDSIAPYKARAGTVEIYTEPGDGGTNIGVNITNMPSAPIDQPRCVFGVTNTKLFGHPEFAGDPNISFAGDAKIDYQTGSGSGRLGPVPNATYSFQIDCYTGKQFETVAESQNSPEPYQPTNPLVQTQGVTIVVDGKPTHPLAMVDPGLKPFDPGPLAPIPSGPTSPTNDVIDDVSPSCSDGVKAAFDQDQIGGNLLETALQALRKPSFEMTAQDVCALTATNPEDAVRALCRAGKSFLPVDWVAAFSNWWPSDSRRADRRSWPTPG